MDKEPMTPRWEKDEEDRLTEKLENVRQVISTVVLALESVCLGIGIAKYFYQKNKEENA